LFHDILYFTVEVMIVRTDPLPFERIRNMRIDADLKQQDIADVLNVRQNTVTQYELGTTRYPVDALIKLALFYGTSVDYLVGLTDVKEPYPRA